MILFRYLTQEIFHYFLWVFTLLFLAIVTNYLSIYLSRAADGNLEVSAVLQILNFLIPNIILLLFPIALFIGVFVAYSRLFNSNELWVMFACGLSWGKLLLYSLIPGVLLTAGALTLSFYVVPTSIAHLQTLTETATARSLALLQPGQFYPLQNNQVAYMNLNSQGTPTFLIAQVDPGSQKTTITYAPHSRIVTQADNAYLQLKQGWRDRFTINRTDMQKINFDQYALRVTPEFSGAVSNITSTPTLQLWHTHTTADIVELRWRCTAGFLPFFAVLMAVVLCRRPPRKGRYYNIIPALLLFAMYCNVLSISRSLLVEQHVPAWLGFEWLNLMVLMASLYLVWCWDGKMWFKRVDKI